MESHSFSEPELVVGGETGRSRHPRGGAGAENKKSDEGAEPGGMLAWRVHVMRNGVAEPIDSIEVNSETLPPRKNRSGKVVWRLPDDPLQLPKFGIHEQRRLWELYKEQKKQRRKQNKGQFANSPAADSNTGDGGEGADDVTPAENAAGGETNGAGGGRDPRRVGPPEMPSTPPAAGRSRPQVTPPPPGFGATTTSAVATLESLSIRESAPSTIPRDTQVSERSMPHRGVSSSPSATAHSIPSPPGLGGISDPRPSQFITRSTSASVADSLPSKPMSKPAPTGGPIVEGRNGSHNPPELFRPPPSQLAFDAAFAVSPPDAGSLPCALAAEVARAFVRLVAAAEPPRVAVAGATAGGGGGTGGASEWLAHYLPRARSTLVMGTAQAAASTREERARQWHSLASSSSSSTPADAGNAKRWECHGWTAQPIDDDPGPEAPGPCRQVLVVLTGRTMQQHLLSFHLSLVLRLVPPPERSSARQQQHREALGADQAASLPPPPPLLLYRISNEVLALALLA